MTTAKQVQDLHNDATLEECHDYIQQKKKKLIAMDKKRLTLKKKLLSLPSQGQLGQQ